MNANEFRYEGIEQQKRAWSTLNDDILAMVWRPHCRKIAECPTNSRPIRGWDFRRRLTILFCMIALTGLCVSHVLRIVAGRSSRLGKSQILFSSVEREDFDISNVKPLPECHSHNDEQQRVPLLDAISRGCASVEADVWMLNDKLYVAHEYESLDWNRTFESAYIKPLLRLLEISNAQASNTSASPRGIFDLDPFQTLVLLVDFKQSIDGVFDIVQRQLQPLRNNEYLSYWDGEELITGPITVVLSGSVQFEKILEISEHRDVFYDAPLHELTTLNEEKSWDSTRNLYNISNSYYASTDFKNVVWLWWRSHLFVKPTSIIRDQIQEATSAGLKSRYWGTPTWPVALRNYVWRMLIREGVDVLNVDDLRAAQTLGW